MYPRHIRFRCERCDLCCRDTERRVRFILLLKTEAERISKEIMMNVYEFAEKIDGFEPYVYMMKKNEDGSYIFPIRIGHATIL